MDLSRGWYVTTNGTPFQPLFYGKLFDQKI